MSKLKAVKPENAAPSKPKVLIYGKPGVGKTWTSLDFPGVYYIDTEGGADMAHYTTKLQEAGGVYFGVAQGSLDFSTVLEQIKALATEKHEYRTVVIDSITKIFNNEIAKEAERLEVAGIKNEFAKDKKPAVAMIKRLISWLQRLDMNVILIAHEKALWLRGEQIGETFDCWDKLEYELHLVLQIIKNGDSRVAKVRKSRLVGFPDAAAFGWSYENFAERGGKGIMEKGASQIVLSTKEQVAELKNLIKTIQIDKELIAKWLTKHNAEKVEEVDTANTLILINYIRKTYLTQGE